MTHIYVTRAVECPTLAEVVAWLERHWWMRTGESEIWDTYVRRVGSPTKVLLSKSAVHFERRMSSTLNSIAEVMGTDTADIYDDIVKHRSEA